MKHCMWVFRGQGHRLFIVLAFLILCTAPSAGQYYREYEDFGWSRGVDWTVPALVDIDGNGLLDLVVGSSLAGLGRWEQTAVHSATFRRVERDYLPGVVAERSAPFFIDIDGNGRWDLLLGYGGGMLKHFEQQNPGGTEFAFVSNNFREIRFDANGKPWYGDLDGDGRNDLLIGTSGNTSPRYVERNVLTGEFERVRDLVFSQEPGFYRHFLPCDLNGDGVKEMFVGTDRGLHLYRQDTAVRDSFVLVQVNWNGITDLEMATTTIADLDGDGLFDLLVGTITGHVRHYEQPSVGAVDGWVLRNDNVLGTWDFGFDTMGYVCDLDRDGRLDILRSEVRSDRHDDLLPIHHFRMLRTGRFEVEYLGAFSGIGMRKNEALTVTDFENDGRLDMLIYRVQKGIEHYRQSSTDPFRFDLVSEDFLPGVYTVQPCVPTVADIDGNGRLDIIVASTDSKLFRYEADGPGSAAFTKTGDPWMNSRGLYPALCFFDYENDGLLDMLQGRFDGTVVHWRQSAAGSSVYEVIDTPVGSINVTSRSQPMVFDVNEDGRLDIVVADGAGGISLFLDEGPNAVDILDEAASASAPTLLPPYPLPATRHVSLPFIVTGSAPVSLAVFDVYGREITRLLDRDAVRAGQQAVSLPVSGLRPGVYFVRMTQASRSAVVRFVVER